MTNYQRVQDAFARLAERRERHIKFLDRNGQRFTLRFCGECREFLYCINTQQPDDDGVSARFVQGFTGRSRFLQFPAVIHGT